MGESKKYPVELHKCISGREVLCIEIYIFTDKKCQ